MASSIPRPDRCVLVLLLVLMGGCRPAIQEGHRSSLPTCGLPAEQQGAWVRIPAGSFVLGQDPHLAGEGPPRRLSVQAFEIQAHEVTNRQFAAFVQATGYVTDAEKSLARQDGGAGSAVFEVGPPPQAGSWKLVPGATWKMPLGPGSTVVAQDDLPVVHVSYRDAQAYAVWAGGRLPNEVEWEYVAQLGLPDPARTTSGAYDGQMQPLANTWQGPFPVVDEGKDGFRSVAPVGCFPPSKQGLYDMIGNVWEWVDTPYQGGPSGTIKGGSWLCSEDVCASYRPQARASQDLDFSSNHIGFRVVRDVP